MRKEVKLKFQHFEEINTEMPEYSSELTKMQPPQVDNKDELDKLEKEYKVHFGKHGILLFREGRDLKDLQQRDTANYGQTKRTQTKEGQTRDREEEPWRREV